MTRNSAAQTRHRPIRLKGFFIIFAPCELTKHGLFHFAVAVGKRILGYNLGCEFRTANNLQQGLAEQESMRVT